MQYIVYFILGGSLVVTIAYLGGRGNTFLAAFVANIPFLFLLNVFLMYRIGGVDGSLSYAKGMLIFLPAFALYVVLTIWLLPYLGMPRSLLPGIPIYLIPFAAKRMLRHRYSKIARGEAQTIEYPVGNAKGFNEDIGDGYKDNGCSGMEEKSAGDEVAGISGTLISNRS